MGGCKRIERGILYQLPSLGMTCDSDPTLLTRAPREGQGPSYEILLLDDTLYSQNSFYVCTWNISENNGHYTEQCLLNRFCLGGGRNSKN